MVRWRKECIAFAIWIVASAVMAAENDLSWLADAPAYPGDEESTELALQLKGLAEQVDGNPPAGLLAQILAAPSVFPLEQLTRNESESASIARSLRSKVVDRALLGASTAEIVGKQQGSWSVELTAPGFWRLEGIVPEGALTWTSTCRVQLHPTSVPGQVFFQPPIWRTRVVDTKVGALVLHTGGELADGLLLNVSDDCVDGVRLTIAWQPLPQGTRGAEGALARASDLELAIRQECEASARDDAGLARCLTEQAGRLYVEGHELDREDQVLAGLPILLSVLGAHVDEPEAALEGLNRALADHFPGCQDMMVSDLMRGVTGLAPFQQRRVALACDTDRRAVGTRGQLFIRTLATPTEEIDVATAGDRSDATRTLYPEQRGEIHQWAATLPAEWRGLDWVSVLDELATPHPEVGDRVTSLLAWLPAVLERAKIPGPNDPPVMVLILPCQCSGGVLEVGLVWRDGRIERLPMLGGVERAEFTGGALLLRAGEELEGDANCCPSVIEQRTLRWVDGAAEWRTDYLPGRLSSELGCWHAARLVDKENVRWVDTSGLDVSRGLLQRRLLACSKDPEGESRRVSRLGEGLRIALDEGPIVIRWSDEAQRWEVKHEAPDT